VKSDEEIMEILEAFNLTGSYRDTAELAGCSTASNSFPGSSTKIVQGCVYSPGLVIHGVTDGALPSPQYQ